MKEAYAVRRTVPPSSEIQAEIDKLLGSRPVDDPQKMLSELARLGARLIIQRAVEEEFDSWLRRGGPEGRALRPPGRRQGVLPAPVRNNHAEGRGPAPHRTPPPPPPDRGETHPNHP